VHVCHKGTQAGRTVGSGSHVMLSGKRGEAPWRLALTFGGGPLTCCLPVAAGQDAPTLRSLVVVGGCLVHVRPAGPISMACGAPAGHDRSVAMSRCAEPMAHNGYHEWRNDYERSEASLSKAPSAPPARGRTDGGAVVCRVHSRYCWAVQGHDH
jgi:hypothetical protein